MRTDEHEPEDGNDQFPNDQRMPNDQGTKRAFDLEERTAVFGENVINFLKTIPENKITGPLISQLVRCSTSVGANYVEADEAGSKNEFRHRISISRREAKGILLSATHAGGCASGLQRPGEVALAGRPAIGEDFQLDCPEALPLDWSLGIRWSL